MTVRVQIRALTGPPPSPDSRTAQIMEGDVIRTLRDNIQCIGHFHTGGVPGRHEINETQELNYRAVATAIADLKFDGYLAHEFGPTRSDPFASFTEAGDLPCINSRAEAPCIRVSSRLHVKPSRRSRSL